MAISSSVRTGTVCCVDDVMRRGEDDDGIIFVLCVILRVSYFAIFIVAMIDRYFFSSTFITLVYKL
jgi:hypothetical protein